MTLAVERIPSVECRIDHVDGSLTTTNNVTTCQSGTHREVSQIESLWNGVNTYHMVS